MRVQSSALEPASVIFAGDPLEREPDLFDSRLEVAPTRAMPARVRQCTASLWLAALLIALAAAGCARLPRLARGPIEVTTAPVVVRFETPVTTARAEWELCFEFDLPRDSDRVSGIQVVLLTRDGGRHALEQVTDDRRGERLICRTGRIPAPLREYTVEAVELRADTPVRLRWLGGGPG